MAVDVDRLGCAPRGFLKLDLQLEVEVLSGTRAPAALAEQVAEESSAKDVAERRHDVLGVAEVVDPGAFQTGVSVPIVALPLALIRSTTSR